MKELYFSTDIETDGKIPGPHSMLSFASAAFTEDGSMLACFEMNLKTLPDAQGDPDTMKWWETQPEAWAACREDPADPKYAMTRYVEWIESFKEYKPVFVAYPAGFDFLFMYWYMIRFAGRSPFSWSALDIKSFAMAMMGTPYRQSIKKNMPNRWFGKGHRHTHKALDDAIEQGVLFCNMLKELQDEKYLELLKGNRK